MNTDSLEKAPENNFPNIRAQSVRNSFSKIHRLNHPSILATLYSALKTLTLIRRDTGYPIGQPESRLPQSYIKPRVPDKDKPQIQNDFNIYS